MGGDKVLVQVKICVDDVKKVCKDVVDTRCRKGQTIECRDEIKEVNQRFMLLTRLLQSFRDQVPDSHADNMIVMLCQPKEPAQASY